MHLYNVVLKRIEVFSMCEGTCNINTFESFQCLVKISKI